RPTAKPRFHGLAANPQVLGSRSPVTTTAPRSPPRILCFFDGACPGNQFAQKGPMKAAFVLGDREFIRDVRDLQTPDGPTRSNNIPEYHGLTILLRHLAHLHHEPGSHGAQLNRGDSQPAIGQFRWRYRVRTHHLAPQVRGAPRIPSRASLTRRFTAQRTPASMRRTGYEAEAEPQRTRTFSPTGYSTVPFTRIPPR